MDTTMIYLAVGVGGVAILLLTARYWMDSNTSDMGTMSRQWLAEYTQSHP